MTTFARPNGRPPSSGPTTRCWPSGRFRSSTVDLPSAVRGDPGPRRPARRERAAAGSAVRRRGDRDRLVRQHRGADRVASGLRDRPDGRRRPKCPQRTAARDGRRPDVLVGRCVRPLWTRVGRARRALVRRLDRAQLRAAPPGPGQPAGPARPDRLRERDEPRVPDPGSAGRAGPQRGGDGAAAPVGNGRAPTWTRTGSNSCGWGAQDFPASPIVRPRRPTAGRAGDPGTPTLVLLAERSRSHNAARAAATARRLLPAARVELLPGATHHTVPEYEPAQLNRRLTEFLSTKDD